MVLFDFEFILFDVKIILFGDYCIYELLVYYDFEFSELFCVIVDFVDEMLCDVDLELYYVCFIFSIVYDVNMLYCDCKVIVCIIEYSLCIMGD